MRGVEAAELWGWDAVRRLRVPGSREQIKLRFVLWRSERQLRVRKAWKAAKPMTPDALQP